MTGVNTESLTAQFEALHAKRVATWEPENLAKNVAQREELVAAYDPAKVAKVGETIATFTLLDVDGGTITADTLTANGPAVLIFFRYAGCPACNIALPYYDRQLWPALSKAGVKLVAVSPQVPEGLVAIKTRHHLGYQVASDTDNQLGQKLGITFLPAKIPAEKPAGWIGEVIGTNTWELPQPTVVIVDQDQVIRFIDVSPDWLDRTEAPEILSFIEGLTKKAIAA